MTLLRNVIVCLLIVVFAIPISCSDDEEEYEISFWVMCTGGNFSGSVTWDNNLFPLPITGSKLTDDSSNNYCWMASNDIESVEVKATRLDAATPLDIKIFKDDELVASGELPATLIQSGYTGTVQMSLTVTYQYDAESETETTETTEEE